MMALVVAVGLLTLMSSTCNKENEPDAPANCTGYVTASASGTISGNYCFDKLTTFTYQPNSYVTLWAAQGDEMGFDVRLNSVNDQALVPGTYNCGSGEPGFVELIYENMADPGQNEFYKSQSGTLTVTKVDADSFEATFNVVAVGYYNKLSINFSGSVVK